MFIGNFAVTRFISIHALREEGDANAINKTANTNISIHALREEGDFTSCLPSPLKNTISIHALREEGDFILTGDHHGGNDFYPRPPRGGRHQPFIAFRVQDQISIHALREEGDGMN